MHLRDNYNLYATRSNLSSKWNSCISINYPKFQTEFKQTNSQCSMPVRRWLIGEKLAKPNMDVLTGPGLILTWTEPPLKVVWTELDLSRTFFSFWTVLRNFR